MGFLHPVRSGKFATYIPMENTVETYSHLQFRRIPSGRENIDSISKYTQKNGTTMDVISASSLHFQKEKDAIIIPPKTGILKRSASVVNENAGKKILDSMLQN